MTIANRLGKLETNHLEPPNRGIGNLKLLTAIADLLATPETRLVEACDTDPVTFRSIQIQHAIDDRDFVRYARLRAEERQENARLRSGGLFVPEVPRLRNHRCSGRTASQPTNAELSNQVARMNELTMHNEEEAARMSGAIAAAKRRLERQTQAASKSPSTRQGPGEADPSTEVRSDRPH